jgi:hypothetical protein
VELFRGERAVKHAWCGVSNPTNCVAFFFSGETWSRRGERETAMGEPGGILRYH